MFENPNIVAIVQARMGSSRLVGKVLMEAVGKSLLEHLVERLGFAEKVGQIVIATSDLPQDKPIVELCLQKGFNYFAGSENDVLDRFYNAAVEFGAEVIVRITADCPLIDPSLVDRSIDCFLDNQGEYDLVTNRHPLTFPDGLDVDVMSIQGLQTAWQHATTVRQREHVIPYFWQAGMQVANIEDPDRGFYKYRWTVDYAEDYELVKAIFEGLYEPGKLFGVEKIKDYLAKNPHLNSVNSKYLPKEKVK